MGSFINWNWLGVKVVEFLESLICLFFQLIQSLLLLSIKLSFFRWLLCHCPLFIKFRAVRACCHSLIFSEFLHDLWIVYFFLALGYFWKFYFLANLSFVHFRSCWFLDFFPTGLFFIFRLGKNILNELSILHSSLKSNFRVECFLFFFILFLSFLYLQHWSPMIFFIFNSRTVDCWRSLFFMIILILIFFRNIFSLMFLDLVEIHILFFIKHWLFLIFKGKEFFWNHLLLFQKLLLFFKSIYQDITLLIHLFSFFLFLFYILHSERNRPFFLFFLFTFQLFLIFFELFLFLSHILK